MFNSSTLLSQDVIFSLLPLIPHNLTLLFISRAKKIQKCVASQGLLLGCNVTMLRKLIFLDNKNTTSKDSN